MEMTGSSRRAVFPLATGGYGTSLSTCRSIAGALGLRTRSARNPVKFFRQLRGLERGQIPRLDCLGLGLIEARFLSTSLVGMRALKRVEVRLGRHGLWRIPRLDCLGLIEASA